MTLRRAPARLRRPRLHSEPQGRCAEGARIGIPRAFYYDTITLTGEERPRRGLNPEQAAVMADAIAILKKQGAIIVDPADVPSFVTKDPKENFLLWTIVPRRSS